MNLQKKLDKTAEERMPQYVKKWVKIGLSTDEVDHQRIEIAARAVYSLAGLPQPDRVVQYKNPVECSLEASQLEAELTGTECNPNNISQAWGNCQFWVGYPALVDFFVSECGVKLDVESTEKAKWYTELTTSIGWSFYGRTVFAYSEKPRRILLDGIGRLHSADQKAIEYRDGWGLCFYHGVAVPEKWILNKEKLTIDDIKKENNAEKKRILTELFGLDRYIREANLQLIDSCPQDHKIVGLRTARLYKGLANEYILDILNSTPEPDGTVKRYQIGIDGSAYDGRASKDCLAALASTWRRPENQEELFFDAPEDYAPEIET